MQLRPIVVFWTGLLARGRGVRVVDFAPGNEVAADGPHEVREPDLLHEARGWMYTIGSQQ